MEKEKECDFPDFSTILFLSNFITSITDRKLPDKLLNKEDLDVLKVVEDIKLDTYDRKIKKNTLPDALVSNPEKKSREKPIQKTTHTGKYETRPKKKPEEKTCR